MRALFRKIFGLDKLEHDLDFLYKVVEDQQETLKACTEALGQSASLAVLLHERIQSLEINETGIRPKLH